MDLHQKLSKILHKFDKNLNPLHDGYQDTENTNVASSEVKADNLISDKIYDKKTQSLELK